MTSILVSKYGKFECQGYWVKVKTAYKLITSKLLHDFALEFILKQTVGSKFGPMTLILKFDLHDGDPCLYHNEVKRLLCSKLSVWKHRQTPLPTQSHEH